MQNLRQHFILAFGLVFVLSGAANAYAKAYMVGAHSIEICAELGNNEVTLGANGEALPALHVCEMCCIAVAILNDAAPYVSRINPANLAEQPRFAALVNPGIDIFSTRPRGPPRLVLPPQPYLNSGE